MTEREKVLNDLQELCEYLFHEYKVCYQGDEEDTYNRFLVANNALNLLKQQEAVEPEVEVMNEIDRLYRCPKCHKCFFYKKQKYCDQCGQAVKWDG